MTEPVAPGANARGRRADDGRPADPAHGHPAPPAPGIARRLACFLYEGVLLFGVVMIAGLLYAGLTQQRHALQGQTGLQAVLFAVIGVYFVVFWTRGGQTLAMRTWHLRVVTASGAALSPLRACARYLLSWLWFLPALASLHLAGLTGGGATFVAIAAGVLAYAALARLHPSRQFLHDLLCGTRLITWRPPHIAQNPAR